MNNVLTASRMTTMMTCLRKSFWAHEVGLRKTEVGLALRIGSAWARATEARWRGADYDAALAFAVPEGIDLDAYTTETVAALLAGYYDHYGPCETMARIHPEVQFQDDIGLGFTAEGKLDGLGTKTNNLTVIVEGKTTSDSLEATSDYWLRLRFNMQLLQYVLAARAQGWDVQEVIYDVVRKPSIRPKKIQNLDSKLRKIVVDANDNRIYLKKIVKTVKGKGKSKITVIEQVDDLDKPRQSGDESKGWKLLEHVETPEEFSDRLWKDTQARPEFYFQRREVPVMEDQLASFVKQREAIARLILSLRENEHADDYQRDPEAWPRNVSEHTCNFCSFKSFCLSGNSVDLRRPPEGFTIGNFNPELEYESTTETTAATGE